MKKFLMAATLLIATNNVFALSVATEPKPASSFTNVLEGLSTSFILFGVLVAIAGGAYYIYKQFQKNQEEDIV